MRSASGHWCLFPVLLFFSFCLFSDISAVSLLEAPELKYGAQLSPSGGVPR